MRVAVEVLRRKLKQLRILDSLHLMHQPDRNVHAFARDQFELLDGSALGRLLDAHEQLAAAQVKRLGLDFVEMQRAFLALANFQDLPAVKIAVRDPHFAAPPFGDHLHRFSCSIHLSFPRLFYSATLSSIEPNLLVALTRLSRCCANTVTVSKARYNILTGFIASVRNLWRPQKPTAPRAAHPIPRRSAES